MSTALEPAALPRRGRPPTGARERLLEAATEVLKEHGYAGITVAKVADRAGESKALIGYHFGSKEGLVLEVGRVVAERVTAEVLGEIEGASSVEEIIRGVLAGGDQIAVDDPTLARLYFDLAAVSVVDTQVKEAIAGITANWRQVIVDLLMAADDGPNEAEAGVAATLLIGAAKGLSLERIERGPDTQLSAAHDLLVATLAAVVSR